MKRKTETKPNVKRPSRKALLKWADAVSDEMPNNLQWSVFQALMRFSDANGVCYPSVDTLARTCKLSVRSVRVGLDALERRGIIERMTRRASTGRQQSNYYAFICTLNEVQPDRSPAAATAGGGGSHCTPITLNSSTSEVKNSIRGKVGSSDSGRGGYRWGPADGVWGDEIPHQTWEELLDCVGGVQ
jgi:hypothetical protein